MFFGTNSLLTFLINYLRNRDRSLSCDPETSQLVGSPPAHQIKVKHFEFRIWDFGFCGRRGVNNLDQNYPFDRKNRLTNTKSEIRNRFSRCQQPRSKLSLRSKEPADKHKIRNPKSEIQTPNSQIRNLFISFPSSVPTRAQPASPSESDSALRYPHRQVQAAGTFVGWRRRRRGHQVCGTQARG
jgi:hypothetical protein